MLLPLHTEDNSTCAFHKDRKISNVSADLQKHFSVFLSLRKAQVELSSLWKSDVINHLVEKIGCVRMPNSAPIMQSLCILSEESKP